MALLDSSVDDIAHRTMGRFAEDQFTPPPRPPLAPPTAADLTPEAAQAYADFDRRQQEQAAAQVQSQLAAAYRIRNAIQPTINTYGAINRLGGTTPNVRLPDNQWGPTGTGLEPRLDPNLIAYGQQHEPPELPWPTPFQLAEAGGPVLTRAAANPVGYVAGLATQGIEKLPTGGGTSLGERINNLPGPLPTVGHFGTGALPFAALAPFGAVGGALGESAIAGGIASPLSEGAAGAISGRQALTEAGINAAMVLAPLVAAKGIGYLTSPEGRAIFDKLVPPEQRQAVLTKLSEERGGSLGGKPPEVGAGGEPRPAGDLLPSPPEAAVATTNPIDEAALAATEYIRKAEKLRPEQEQMFSEQRRQQLATAEQRFQQSGPNANIEARQGAAGAFERPEFAPLELSPEHDAAIQHEINTSDQLSHAGERFQAHDALDALKKGQLPQPAQLAALGKVLGPDFEQAVLDRAPRNWWNTAMEVLSTSRALQATLDLSAALRQGIVGSVGHPIRFSQAFVAQLHALFSGDYARQVHESIINDPRYDLVRGKVDLTALPGEAKNQLTHREEAFQSQLAEQIPGIGRLIKASDRAFSTFTNKFRHDLAFDAIERYQRSNGTLPSEKWLDNLGHYVNNLTGRGDTKWLGDHSATVNAVFFSPKFLASRFQLVADLVRPTQSAEIRMLAAKDLASFVASGVGVLAAMKAAGINVEIDPRSSDFGKYVVGGQHHDFWAGYGPIARLIAQEATGERAKPSLTHGNVISERDYAGAMTSFLRNKFSPPASLLADWSQGTQGGKDVNLTSLKSIDKDNPILQRITPLFIQDAIQMYRQDGTKGLLGAPAAGLGESVTSYEPTTKQLSAQDKLAVQQKLADTGFKPIIDRRAQATAARDAYKAKYGGTKEAEVKAMAYYDAHPKVVAYLKKINDDELAFWSKPANKALLKEAWNAGIDVQLGDAQVKKLLGIK